MPSRARARRILLVGVATFAVSALVACGPSTAAELERSDDATISFDYAGFSAEIPADPERVLVIEGRADLEFSLTLGYPVVASGFFFGRDGHLYDELDELMADDLATFEFADSNEPDYEAIAALDPDLIVMRLNAYNGDFYGADRLEQIAPVLALDTGATDWKGQMREQAAILERSEQVEAEIARYDDLVEEIRARSGDRLDEMSLAWGTALDDVGMYVFTNTHSTAVAEDLGIDVPLSDPEDEENYFEISAENFDIVSDVDTLALFAFDESPALGESAAFQRLPASRSDRVFSVDLTLNNGLARAATALAVELEEMANAG
ncbi:ABC transporter substrate-binding protein [Microbacterium suaedae]|uniref:ABC transporter substrate-binding protein n=1 Tax=Microbacterium suaedae TaxID=2067813 RepID=UPI000DA23F5E|nr:ABC transporter substrate-binding protein [Microbacterium suaedae]